MRSILRSQLFDGILIFSLALVGLCGCQTDGPKRFEAIRNGMEKSAVVETIGSPTITRRVNGRDRWIYQYRDHSDTVVTREVHFEGGKAVYAGPPIPPPVTASEQDRLNEITVQKEDAAAAQELQARDRRLGIQRAHSKDQRVEGEDRDDRKLRESYYGVEPDPTVLKNTVAPVFTPVQ